MISQGQEQTVAARGGGGKRDWPGAGTGCSGQRRTREGVVISQEQEQAVMDGGGGGRCD